MMEIGDDFQRRSTRRRTKRSEYNNESMINTNGHNKGSKKRNSRSVDRKVYDKNSKRSRDSRSSTGNSLQKAVRRRSKISSPVSSDSSRDKNSKRLRDSRSTGNSLQKAVRRRSKISSPVSSDLSREVLSINSNPKVKSKRKRKSDFQEEHLHYKYTKKSNPSSCNTCREPVKKKIKNASAISLNSSKRFSYVNEDNNHKETKRKRKSFVDEEQPRHKRSKLSVHKDCGTCKEPVKNRSRKKCAVLSESSKDELLVYSNNLEKLSKLKKKSNAQELVPKCNCLKTTKHNNYDECQGHQSTKPVVRRKTSRASRRLIEIPCKKSIFDKACNLRQIIESGELLPDNLRPLLNERVAKKYNTNELAATIKESKCEWQKTEKRALKLVKLIRAALSIDKPNPEKCLPLLDELQSLDIDALMLKRNPILVHTVQVLCRYVGNTGNDITEEEKKKFIEHTAQVRSKSEILFQKFRKLFKVKNGQPFMRLYKEKVLEYKETKSSKFLRELCQKVTKRFCRTKKPRQSKKKISKNSKN